MLPQLTMWGRRWLRCGAPGEALTLLAHFPAFFAAARSSEKIRSRWMVVMRCSAFVKRETIYRSRLSYKKINDGSADRRRRLPRQTRDPVR